MRNQTRIEDRIALRPLGSIENAPPSLVFDRPRSIRLPWADFAKATETDHDLAMKSASDALRAGFEASWNLPDATTRSDAEVQLLLAEGLLASQSTKEDGKPRFQPLQDAGSLDPGVYARHGSGRWYRLLARQELSLDAFKTRKLYHAAWEGVFGIEMVRDTLPDAVPSESTSTEFIDLRAPFIEARYGELILGRNIAAATHAAARDSFDNAARELRVFDEHKQGLLDAARELDRFEQALKRLARQASEMGYTLFVEPATNYKRTKAETSDVETVVRATDDVETSSLRDWLTERAAFCADFDISVPMSLTDLSRLALALTLALADIEALPLAGPKEYDPLAEAV